MKTKQYVIKFSPGILFDVLNLKLKEKIELVNAGKGYSNDFWITISSSEFPEYEMEEGQDYKNAIIMVHQMSLKKEVPITKTWIEFDK